MGGSIGYSMIILLKLNLKKKLCCEIKYTPYQKVKYIIFWKENNIDWNVYSERSATGTVNSFLKVCILYLRIIQ